MNEPKLHHGGQTHGRDRSASAPAHVGGESTARPSHLPGLVMVDAGLRLEAEPGMTAAGDAMSFEFRILGPTHRPITDFDELHERRMHLIVVRRDLTGFQHLHPRMSGDGTWGTSLTLPTGGVWRAFADFSTGGTAVTLGVDMFAEGAFRPEPLPPPAPTAEANGDVVSSTSRRAVASTGPPLRVTANVCRWTGT